MHRDAEQQAALQRGNTIQDDLISVNLGRSALVVINGYFEECTPGLSQYGEADNEDYNYQQFSIHRVVEAPCYCRPSNERYVPLVRGRVLRDGYPPGVMMTWSRHEGPSVSLRFAPCCCNVRCAEARRGVEGRLRRAARNAKCACRFDIARNLSGAAAPTSISAGEHESRLALGRPKLG